MVAGMDRRGGMHEWQDSPLPPSWPCDSHGLMYISDAERALFFLLLRVVFLLCPFQVFLFDVSYQKLCFVFFFFLCVGFLCVLCVESMQNKKRGGDVDESVFLFVCMSATLSAGKLVRATPPRPTSCKQQQQQQ
jgi:hypothetical protein